MDSALNKDGNYYPLVILTCKDIKKKVIRHIIDHLESFFDDSDDSDEEWIKAMKLMFLEERILKMQFCIFWGSNFQNVHFENVFFEGAIFKIYFLGMNFENVFFERAILKMYFSTVPKVSWLTVFGKGGLI